MNDTDYAVASIVISVKAVSKIVYGQPNMTSNTANNGGISATSLWSPGGIAVDTLGGLFVADTGNNRVLYYPSGSTTATVVYGQSNMTTNTANIGAVSANKLWTPYGVAIDSIGGLYVADAQNNRVLYYRAGNTTASVVYGQPDMASNTANNGGISAASLFFPTRILVDLYGGLYIADTSNNRVLKFKAAF